MMSAINGIYYANKQPVPHQHSNRMMQFLEKYSFDKIGVWNHQNVFFSCHAQWITPESIGERLPYYDCERQLTITADAIIDNREELFDQLDISGNQRKEMPDSKIILLAYDKWKEDSPKYLLGDFAFMIWDEKEQKLFGARDFSGARTLYYYQEQNKFAFSTLIEPLFALPYIEKKLNEEWLAEFLVIPTMVEAVDMSSTIYKSIFQLPPAHCISVIDGRSNLTRYCTIEIDKELKLKSNEEYEEAFRATVNKAVKARLRTHGKVGSHLSGGLDSGTVVSFAARELKKQNKQLHTYSYVPEKDFEDWTSKYYLPDERSFIEKTVNYVGNINDQYFSFEGKNPLSEVDDFLELMEMPYKFFENSFWLKGLNETANKQGIKVLLNGARGNHSISWGSQKLNLEYYTSLIKKLKWRELYKELDSYTENYHTGKSNVLPIIVKQALPEKFRKLNNNRDVGYQFPILINSSLAKRTDVFERLQQSDINMNGEVVKSLHNYRKNYYNQLYAWNKSGVAETKLSLRYLLWNRDPTNDLNVIRFCLALPEKQYTLGGIERSIIRRATKDFLPNEVRLNHKMRGLQGADTIHRISSNWKQFLEELQEISNDSLLSEFLDTGVIKKCLAKVGKEPRPELIFYDEFKTLTRSLIVSRFLKSLN